MVHSFVRELLPARKVLIAGMLIGRDQIETLSLSTTSINKAMERRHICVFDHLADHVALAADRADDRSFVASAANVMLFLVPVPIFVFPADIGFVHFDDAHKLAEIQDRRVRRGADGT